MSFTLKPVLFAILAAGLAAPVLADDAALLRQMQEQMQQMQAQIEAMSKKLAEQSESQKKVVDSVAKVEKDEKARNSAAEFYGRLSLSADDNSEDFGPGTNGLGFNSNSSRFGFRGEVPTSLGGNTSITYNAEVQYGAADGPTDTGNTNEFIMREGFVGLKGGWGSTRVGRLTTPYKAVYAIIDPWTDQVPQARQGGRQGASAINANYFNNAIEYISPKLADSFTLSAWYSKQFDGENAATTGFMHNAGPLNQLKGGGVVGLGAKYESGPWLASLDWADFDADVITPQAPVTRNLTNDSALKLTGRYKAKDWSVSTHYEDTEDMGLGKNIYLNGIYVIDKLSLIASYGINQDARTFISGGVFNDAKTWSLGARYRIAKNSDLFAVYNSRSQDGDTNGAVAGVQDQFDTLSIGLVTNFSSK